MAGIGIGENCAPPTAPGAALYVWKQLTPSTPQQLGLGIAFGMTDVGTVRATNEDNFLIDPELGLVAVADGMGGHEAGEVASASALGALAHFLRASGVQDGDSTVPNFIPSAFNPVHADPDATWTDATMGAMIRLHDAVEFANARMYQTNLADAKGDGGGMGPPLPGLWQPAADGPVFIFHVGDSRLYRLRHGELVQLTRDQTMYQQSIEAGMLHNLPGRNLLLQALGPAPEVAPELQIQALAPGDVLLLCSDGLHGACADADIGTVLQGAAGRAPGEVCAQLIEMAKRAGSRDNITALLIRCKD